jgi:hypothetical protein
VAFFLGAVASGAAGTRPGPVAATAMSLRLREVYFILIQSDHFNRPGNIVISVKQISGLRKRLAVAAVLAGILPTGNSARAHHADTVFDKDRLVTVTGIAARFEFTNPHNLIYLDARNERGELRRWLVYGAAPVALRRAGWSQKTIRPGEELTVTGFQRKDGRRNLLHLKIVRANGEIVPMGEAEENYLQKFEARQKSQP